MNKLMGLALVGLTAVFSVTAAIAAGDAAAGKQKAEACAACHGPGGYSTNPAWPRLAGQHADYIAKQLHDFKGGSRSNPIMSAQAVNLSEQDMADLAAFFASQPPAKGVAVKDAVQLGERTYRGGNAESGVPACMACHGPTGAGNPAAKFPRIGGQHPDYLAAQLKAYRSGDRHNDGDSKIMRGIAAHMTDAEIEAVSQYAAGLQ